jgi:mRNA interferase RelE/StbE
LTTRSYRMRIADSAVALIRGLHPQLKRKVKCALRELATDPLVGKILRDELEGFRAFRVGRLRIVYRIAGKSIEIAAVGPRKTIYQETAKMIKRNG